MANFHAKTPKVIECGTGNNGDLGDGQSIQVVVDLCVCSDSGSSYVKDIYAQVAISVHGCPVSICDGHLERGGEVY